MATYVYAKDHPSFNHFCVINKDELPNSGVVRIEDVSENNTIDYNYIILIEDVKFHNSKPIIYSKEKAKAIFKVFRFCVRSYYVHPTVVDQEFLDWFVEEYPMDILSLPLEEIDYDMAMKTLIMALHALEDTQQYSYQWFSNIFRDMPMKFKDEQMCIWAYNNNHDLISTFPTEYKTYDMFFNLPDNTYLWLNDVPMVYRDEAMCNKFLDMKGGIGDKSMNLGYVPGNLRTRELCYKHFEKSVNTLIYIPGEYITYEMCLDAAERHSSLVHSDFIRVVPQEYQTDDFWRIYVANHWYFKRYILDYVPQHLRNDEFIKKCNDTAKNFWEKHLDEHIKEKEKELGQKWVEMEIL